MNRRVTTWALAGLVALAGPARADECKVEKKDAGSWQIQDDGKDWEVHPATPSYDGSTGLFHMSTAYTLPKGKFAFSLFRDNLDRDPKDIDASIHGLNLAVGATSRLELFGHLGLQHRVDADATFQSGYNNDFPFAGSSPTSSGWQTGVGDVKLGLKFKLLDDYRGDPLGLALRGIVKLGTADDAKGLGTGKTSFEGDLILSKSLGRAADIHGSVGYRVNSDPDTIDLANELRWGVGLNLPACKQVQLQAEVMGSSYSGGGFPQTKPLDLVVGPVFWIKPGFFIRPAISWNLSFDDRGLNSSSKSYTGRHIAIGYHPGTPCCEVVQPPPPPPPPQNHPPTVLCEVEKSNLIPGETVRCRATASDPDGDPLTYTWTASAGTVTGSGAQATFDSAGVAPGTSVDITVRVSDGRGGTAESTCHVKVEKPQATPQLVPCSSGGFPRNLARLNNVDKACLDDMASRLKSDPRSRLFVDGHADSSERYPEVIGRKRAEAVKAYLVKERGVDESRVTARSKGASKPIDPGTSAAARAKNRRVELIFVPEGATPPEDDDD